MKVTKYTNMFGEEVTVDTRKKNPMVKTFGKGPDEFKCKDCVHFIVKQFSKTYFKCGLRGNTSSAATDHRANWQTCSKFIKSWP